MITNVYYINTCCECSVLDLYVEHWRLPYVESEVMENDGRSTNYSSKHLRATLSLA